LVNEQEPNWTCIASRQVVYIKMDISMGGVVVDGRIVKGVAGGGGEFI
jgi:hypothetical protein